MATFPTLKTGAIAQYPAERSRVYSTAIYRFLGGEEQRFRNFRTELKKWTLRLDLLDEGELRSVTQFFVEQSGRAGSFIFTDPWDGVTYNDCSFDGDELQAEYLGSGAGRAQVRIKENRS